MHPFWDAFLVMKSGEKLFCFFSVNNNAYLLYLISCNNRILKRGFMMNVWSEEESSYTLSNLTNRDIELAEKHFQVKLLKA
jgi:hypothetical protein